VIYLSKVKYYKTSKFKDISLLNKDKLNLFLSILYIYLFSIPQIRKIKDTFANTRA